MLILFQLLKFLLSIDSKTSIALSEISNCNKKNELFNWRNKPKLINEKKHKKACNTLHYIERLFISAPTATG